MDTKEVIIHIAHAPGTPYRTVKALATKQFKRQYHYTSAESYGRVGETICHDTDTLNPLMGNRTCESLYRFVIHNNYAKR